MPELLRVPQVTLIHTGFSGVYRFLLAYMRQENMGWGIMKVGRRAVMPTDLSDWYSAQS
jgi:hypothetical protein